MGGLMPFCLLRMEMLGYSPHPKGSRSGRHLADADLKSHSTLGRGSKWMSASVTGVQKGSLPGPILLHALTRQKAELW